MNGFLGPRDIFRNPEAIFRFCEPTTGAERSKSSIDIALNNKVRWGPGPSPFNLVLTHSGSDFAVCGMHFKIGLYEHQSAGALGGLVNLLIQNPAITKTGIDGVENINVVAYEPAFGIIGDPAKKNPTTRQSADHSMAFIVSRMLKKALETGSVNSNEVETWKTLMLSPYDYGKEALECPKTKQLMSKITFTHGGPDYDSKYPEGIPTSIDITLKGGKALSSGLVMFPPGHARNSTANLAALLEQKNKMLGDLVFADAGQRDKFTAKLVGMKTASAADMQSMYDFDYSKMRQHPGIDGPRPATRQTSSRL
jgi:2-methylcitrate dehydratase